MHADGCGDGGDCDDTGGRVETDGDDGGGGGGGGDGGGGDGGGDSDVGGGNCNGDSIIMRRMGNIMRIIVRCTTVTLLSLIMP